MFYWNNGIFRFTKKIPCYIFGEHARQLFLIGEMKVYMGT